MIDMHTGNYGSCIQCLEDVCIMTNTTTMILCTQESLVERPIVLPLKSPTKGSISIKLKLLYNLLHFIPWNCIVLCQCIVSV